MANRHRRSLRQYASFETARKGYAPKQVDAFLDQLDEAFRELEDLLKESQRKVRKLELEVDQAGGVAPSGGRDDEISARAEMEARVTIEKARAKPNERPATAGERPFGEERPGTGEAIERPKPTEAELEARAPQSEKRRSGMERRHRRDVEWAPTAEFDEVAGQLEAMAGHLADSEDAEASTGTEPRSGTDKTAAPTHPDSAGPEAGPDGGEPASHDDAKIVAADVEYSEDGSTVDWDDIRQMLATMSEPQSDANSSGSTEDAHSAKSGGPKPRTGAVPREDYADETKRGADQGRRKPAG